MSTKPSYEIVVTITRSPSLRKGFGLLCGTIKDMKYAEFTKDGQKWKVPDAFYRVSVKLIIKNKEDKLLILKNIVDNDYEIPGGGIDWDETHRQALERELSEELGLSLQTMDEKPFASEHSVHVDGYRVIKIYYFGTVTGQPVDNEPDMLEHFWVSKTEFLSLPMQSEEKKILKHADTIWPATKD